MNENTTVLLIATVIGETYEWSPQISGSELAIAAARKGFQEWLQDAASTAKPSGDHETNVSGRATKACRIRHMDARFEKIKNGTYSPGAGGGGGARSSTEDQAWIMYFNQLGRQEAGKPVIKKTLERAQKTLCRQRLLEEFPVGTPEHKDVSENLARHINTRFVGWISQMEENEPGIKMAIEYFKMMATVATVK